MKRGPLGVLGLPVLGLSAMGLSVMAMGAGPLTPPSGPVSDTSIDDLSGGAAVDLSQPANPGLTAYLVITDTAGLTQMLPLAQDLPDGSRAIGFEIARFSTPRVASPAPASASGRITINPTPLMAPLLIEIAQSGSTVRQMEIRLYPSSGDLIYAVRLDQAQSRSFQIGED
ncbi:MAG: hypothetical protein AAFU70_05720, partial [Planctomycetota bacterium]